MSSKTVGKRLEPRDYVTLVGRIFDEDKRIRFAAIYSGHDLVSGGMRPGISSYDPEEEARELDLELAKIAKSTSNSERWFRELGGIIITYKKVNLALFPLEGTEKFVVVSSEPDYNLLSLLEKLAALR